MTSQNNEDPYDRSLKHINRNVLPKLRQRLEAVRGRKISHIKFVHDESKKGAEQFQSVAIFGKIVYECHSSEIHEISVIVKTQICDEGSMSFNNGGVQFFNENMFYADLLSYFSKVVNDIGDVFPRYIYGFVPDSNNRLEDIVILEDLSKENYRLAPSKTEISLEHILLALKGLGKFHACSYIMKSIDKDTFLSKMSAIKDMRAWVTNPKDSHQNFLAKNSERGLKYLERFPEYKDKLDNVRHFLNNISDSLPRLFETNDKTSVLCHGDFCRNNMFFKYENDQPVSVKFFDMATIIYASPVIDIAFFLYLNTGQEQRLRHWDTMIETYYDSLKQTCLTFSGSAKVVFPSYEDIVEEFKLKSMTGYLPCGFFLPMMMLKIPEDRSVWGSMCDAELIEFRLATSGEEGTKAVGEILKHMVDNGFI